MKRHIITVIITAILLSSISYQTINAVAGQWSASGTMIYYNDGKVNLGTTTPTWAKMAIQSSSYSEDYLIFKTPTTNTQFRFMSPNDQKMELVPFDHTTSTAHWGAFTMMRNGNIGIGTETPTSKLAVNGTIKAKEIIVSTNSTHWPDYVFEDDYKLMSIKELENYIKLHKHLPNIPDAEVVEVEGISLGEMQKLQMEKIEELTLHLIVKDKQIEDLSQKLRNLEILIHPK